MSLFIKHQYTSIEHFFFRNNPNKSLTFRTHIKLYTLDKSLKMFTNLDLRYNINLNKKNCLKIY